MRLLYIATRFLRTKRWPGRRGPFEAHAIIRAHRYAARDTRVGDREENFEKSENIHLFVGRRKNKPNERVTATVKSTRPTAIGIRARGPHGVQ